MSTRSASLLLASGMENTGKPYICLNGKVILKDEEIGRGLNMAVVDGNVKEVIITQRADTYAEAPESLVKFLTKIAPGDVLMVVTSDDAARMLSKDVKEILNRDFNSRLIYDLAYRSTWVFIGQKGVKSSVQIEKLNLIHGQWGEKIDLHGCLSLPMDFNTSTVEQQRDSSNNCNIQEHCGNSKFPVAIQSGGDKAVPTVCVDGKQVLGPVTLGDFQPASRGLNCLVFDPSKMKIVKVGHFDTYNSAIDDSLASSFLEVIEDGQIVIIVIYDEASRKLTAKTKNLLSSLGSSKIEDFNFRDNWLFIGQKGIKGFSPFEQLGFRQGSGWGAKLDFRKCVPLKIEGKEAVSSLSINRKRIEFCKQYNTYSDLCSEENVNKSLKALPLDDTSLSSNLAYTLPILVVPGVDLEPLQKCLSSLIAVPGLKPGNVLVVLDGNFAEPNDLIGLYGFTIEYIKPKTVYSVFLHDAITRALQLFKDKEYLIVLEERLEVTPDFLRYFSQAMHILNRDSSVFTISAWNPNGFTGTSGDETLLYRTEDFPGFGWIVRRTLWTDRFQTNQKTCCNNPSWRGWNLGEIAGGESIIPDVSRVRRISRDGGYYEEKAFMTQYLAHRINSSAGPQSEPTEVYKLEGSEYEQEVGRLVSHSIPITPDSFTACLNGGTLALTLPKYTSQIYAVFYEQDSVDDHKLLRLICTCFGLFVFEDVPLHNMHKGIVRFTFERNHFILVGSKTIYFNSHPANTEVLSNMGNASNTR
ncbi:protein O-linked-mannose beta-1,2-N-acetylglucosaminyltransferase 1-like [Asterias rubens]|uniref:protein O-linked-mannose beta-1,2-N-acetylglucosaminyltransferase 1-like n=1 Tax=Asterias rubens TaxID=7604 RepID=UPI0014552990|nr:protein O-linked-mannose beta-1,2-N-acetylglucosaminyltransferase 1-like [Asterias rubens]